MTTSRDRPDEQSGSDPRLDLLEAWWNAGPAAWFTTDQAFDAMLRERFGPLHAQALAGGVTDWTETPHGTLAYLILTDQIPRNIHRGTPLAFSTDPLALKAAEAALARGFPRAFPPGVRCFFYLPFEHAEDMAAQERSVDLFRALGDEEHYLYALIHMDAIRRFGRFPHRNVVLGRTSTPEEERYLATGGFKG